MDQSSITKELEALRRENETLRAENQSLHARSLRDFMERAIRDDQLSRGFTAHIQQYYALPVSPWYVCILFWGEKPSGESLPENAPLDTVFAAFSDELLSFGQPYFFESSGTVVCLLNADLDEDPAAVGPEFGRDFSAALAESLFPIWKSKHRALQISHITISHVGTMAQGPRFLYRSAVSASERRTDESPAVCVEAGNQIPIHEDFSQAFALESRFWQQVEQHAFFDAATTLDQLIEMTTLEQGSLERTLASVFSRMELVLRSTVPTSHGDPLHEPEFDAMLPALSDAGSFWEMRQIAYDILATLEDRFYTPPNTRNKKLGSIEGYIQEHYAEQNLSASSLAERFKLSPSYLSRIFKADKNMGIIDYLHRVRIDAAKELLEKTDLGMEEIARQSGFSNRWSLNRVFKDIVGITPGAYRSKT